MTAGDPEVLLRKKVQELQALLDFGQAVARLGTAEEILHGLALTISGQWALSRYGIAVLREGRDPLVRQRGFPALAGENSPCADAVGLLSGLGPEPVRLFPSAGGPLGTLAATGARALVPLSAGGAPAGLVVLGERHGGLPWSDEELAQVAGLGVQALVAMKAAWQRAEAERWRRGGPRVVAGYELLERIGSGGMAEVFRARSRAGGSELAVKLVSEKRVDDPRARERFEREGRIAAGIDHPGIVRIVESGSFEGQLFIAMELLPGEPVSERLRRGPTPLREAVRALWQVGSALTALHASGVVHRDVKSSNIMSLPGGDFVLLDFGLARALDTPSLTRSEEVVGTVAYLAPELLRGSPAVASSDIWALGVVFLEMLGGRRPWKPLDGFALAMSILGSPPDLPAALESGEGAPFLPLVERMLDRDPSGRFADGAALLRALSALAAPEELAPRTRRWRETGPGDPTVVAPVAPVGAPEGGELPEP